MSFKNDFEECEGFNQVFDSWFFRYTHKNRIYMRYACFSAVFSRKNMVEATMRQPWMSYQIRLVMIIVDELPDDAVLKGKVMDVSEK